MADAGIARRNQKTRISRARYVFSSSYRSIVWFYSAAPPRHSTAQTHLPAAQLAPLTVGNFPDAQISRRARHTSARVNRTRARAAPRHRSSARPRRRTRSAASSATIPARSIRPELYRTRASHRERGAQRTRPGGPRAEASG